MTTSVNNDSAEEHKEAVALLDEVAACLRLSTGTVHDLAEKVSGRSWDQLDIASAERVVNVLSDLLHRTLVRRSLIPPDARPVASEHARRPSRNAANGISRSMYGK